MKIRKNYLLLCVLFFISIIMACSDSSGSSGGNTGDTTPPAWNSGYPKAIDLDDRIYVKASLNESGHVYCVLRRDGDPAPSVQDIADGLGEFAIDAEAGANTVTTLIFKDLSYSNAFDLYCVGADDLKNIQTSYVKIDILTSARNTVFVSQTEGNDINMGSISYPTKTIASAIEYARVNFPFSMARKVCVSQGTYLESVELRSGISLMGGYSKSDWSERDIEDRTNSECATGISGTGAVNYGLRINGTNNSSSEWVVEGFTIESNHASNSYGIDCIAGSPVKIRYNTINGGAGLNESNGIYVHNNATTKISNNIINGGSSTNAASNGIYVETSEDQIISDNIINGGTGNNSSNGIIFTYPVDYDTLIINNQINAGKSFYTYGIYLTHYVDNATSSPLIYGNSINGGTSLITGAMGIYLRGEITRSISPVICNNLINPGIGTGDYSFGVTMYSDGHVYLYNNTINGEDSDAFGITINNHAGTSAIASILNNIVINTFIAIIEHENSLCDVIKNNDLYNCGILYDSSVYGEITSIDDLNELHAGTSGNITIDPLPDTLWDFTDSSPASVTGGGLDLSAYPYYQENASGQKIDITGKVRTAPWSIGAYEKE